MILDRRFDDWIIKLCCCNASGIPKYTKIPKALPPPPSPFFWFVTITLWRQTSCIQKQGLWFPKVFTQSCCFKEIHHVTIIKCIFNYKHKKRLIDFSTCWNSLSGRLGWYSQCFNFCRVEDSAYSSEVSSLVINIFKPFEDTNFKGWMRNIILTWKFCNSHNLFDYLNIYTSPIFYCTFTSELMR